MPDPNNVSPGFNKGYVDLSQAPGADDSWDNLFQNPENAPAAQPQVAPGTNPPAEPQAVQAPFLKAGNSVYNTAEDAVHGVAHKDELIDRYRTFLSQNGYDPNELRRVAPEPVAAQPDPQNPTSPFKYLNNGKQYYADLAKAADRNNPNPEAYEQIQRTYQQEVLQNFLAPYGPLLAETARQRAGRQVSSEIPDFARFHESPEFTATVKASPLLGEMLEIGENNPQASARLPEVYKQIYLTYQGISRQRTDSSTAQLAPPVQNTPTARPVPTMSTSSLTPPAPGSDTRNWTTDREARKQLIADGRAKLGDVDWGSLGT
jgi:hypothetical protein